jgi:hypothetical protein
MGGWDGWWQLTFQVALVRGPESTILVNTGPARDLAPMNNAWASFLGERAAMTRVEGEFILDQLSRLGIEPGEVTHVILTPLQLYSVSNVLAFENAHVCIARRGWVHFHTTHEHPHDVRANSIPDEILVELVTSAWPRLRLLADEDEVVPGVRTWWSGGHHRASLCVEVTTRDGVAAMSDCFFYRENVDQDRPIGINESLDETLAAYERIRRTADLIVPLYDPHNVERFPGGRIG